MGGMGIFATLVPVSAFLAGLKRVGPRDASLLSTFEPAVTVALAALILSEPVRMDMLLGGGLILAAVILTVSKQINKLLLNPNPISSRSSADCHLRKYTPPMFFLYY